MISSICSRVQAMQTGIIFSMKVSPVGDCHCPVLGLKTVSPPATFRTQASHTRW
jgi:hypothetical protein